MSAITRAAIAAYALVCFLSVSAPTANAQGYPYTLTEVPLTLDGVATYKEGLNSYGDITGTAQYYGYIYSFASAAMTSFGSIAESPVCYALNDFDVTVGGVWSVNWPNQQAFSYQPGGSIQLLGYLGTPTSSSPNSVAHAINDAGEIVGTSTTATGRNHAFLYANGRMTDLGTPGGSSSSDSYGTDINSVGDIITHVYTPNNPSALVLYKGMSASVILTSPALDYYGAQINDSDQIVGDIGENGPTNGTRAFLYSAGQLTIISIPGSFIDASSINNNGVVVGSINYNSPLAYCYLYDGGSVVPLPPLIDPALKWSVITANRINDNGQITGTGLNPQGQPRFFILTPVAGAVGLASISPSPIPAATGADTVLDVVGIHFGQQSQALWNGAALATTFISNTHLRATVPAALTSAIGSAVLTVQTPAMATSNPQTVAIAPSLISITPATVDTETGDFVLTATGTAFEPGAQVIFNGQALSAATVSPTQVTATVPGSATSSLAPGSYNVSIKNPDSSVSNTLPLSVTNPYPHIDSISPSSVPHAGPFTLTVSGHGFSSYSEPMLGLETLTPSTITPTQMTIVLSGGSIATAGGYDFYLRDYQTADSNHVTLTATSDNPVPVLSPLSPSVVPDTLGGSEIISVSGDGFVPQSVVYFNQTALPTSFVYTSELTATLPAALMTHPGTATLTVVNPAPAGGASNGQTLTLENPYPVIKSVKPTFVKAGSPSAVSVGVTGSGFLSGMKATFNGASVKVVVKSAVSAVVTLPASALTIPTAQVPLVFDNPAPEAGTGQSAVLDIATTALSQSLGVVTRDAATGSYCVPVTITNTGYLTAPSVTADGLIGRTHVFVSAGDLAAGGSATVTFTFPSNIGAPGKVVTFSSDAGFTGIGPHTTLKVKITLPG